MDTINTMLIMDLIIVVLGIYLLYLSLHMKKTKKVERFIVKDEVMKLCKDEPAFAEYLSVRMLGFSVTMIIGGVIMALNESVFDMGNWIYIVIAVVVVAFLLFYKQLTDGKIKYC